MKTEIVYQQMGTSGISGRVIRVKGKLIAQISKDNKFQRANTNQATALFRNALQLTLLQPGESVVAVVGRRVVFGTYVGCIGDRFEVCIRRDENVLVEHLLPAGVAVETGMWPFRPDMLVAAYVHDRWLVGRWQGYEDGQHSVRLIRGETVTSDCAHTAAYAVEHGLVQD